ncbi:VWA domain-containing protein, partial [Fundidesulfovibrio magnetotacticus]|uniref:VWA domain-containing protein n=1 Tax=Fundidesulfovibrio magnetotacticus TaxID=2730080 RepID=UPI003530814D
MRLHAKRQTRNDGPSDGQGCRRGRRRGPTRRTLRRTVGFRNDNAPFNRQGGTAMSDELARRLPVYLVVDISGSMAGEKIESVRQGIRSLLADLRCEPVAIETVCLSVITFGSSARQESPLSELMHFQEPVLRLDGATSMGAALRLLKECIEREVKKSSSTQKGDWKPLIFLMTDGQPTDTWEAAAEDLKRARP